MTSVKEIKLRIAAIDAQIRAVEERLPAHSVKPPIMIELFALEEERGRLLDQLAHITAAP